MTILRIPFKAQAHFAFCRNLLRLSRLSILLGLGATCQGLAQEAHPPEPLTFQEVSFRETTDQAWTLRFAGKIPSRAGCYVLVHDKDSRVVAMAHIPYGAHPENDPFIVEIPRDGISGDYRLVIVGKQADKMGIALPVSDIALEVYGSFQFAKNGKDPLWFIAPPEVIELQFLAHRGTLEVLDANGNVLAETAQSPEFKAYTTVVKVKVEPGKVYGIRPGVTGYYMNVGEKGRIDVAFDPAKLFVPDAQLQKVVWWQLTEKPIAAKTGAN